jgi:hypothetical protein
MARLMSACLDHFVVAGEPLRRLGFKVQTVIASIACVRCHHALTAAQSRRPVIFRRAARRASRARRVVRSTFCVIGEVVEDLHASLKREAAK